MQAKPVSPSPTEQRPSNYCSNNWRWYACLLLNMTLYAVIILSCWICYEVINAKGRIPSQANTCSKRISSKLRSGFIAPESRWPDNTILYKIDPDFPKTHAETFFEAQAHIKGRTCIRFKEWSTVSEVQDYIYVLREGFECSADVGRNGSHSNFYMGQFCFAKRVFIHELVHTIGFYHEHERSDRDHFVTLNWENMLPGNDKESMLLNDNYVSPFDIPYDYNSIMHYERNHSSTYGYADSITPMDPNVVIGKVRGLSHFDIKKINHNYCPGTMGIRLQNVASGQYLQVARAEGPVVTFDWSDDETQKWTVKWSAMLKQLVECSTMVPWSQNNFNVSVMTVNDAYDSVRVRADDNSDEQKWRVERVPLTEGSMWKLINCGTAKCILANSNSQAVQRPCGDSSDRRLLWRVYSV